MSEPKQADPRLSRTTATQIPTERENARPTAGDMSDPAEVWKDGETKPSRDRAGTGTGGEAGRVADAGDLEGRGAAPYGEELQVDAIVRQSERDAEPDDDVEGTR